LEKKCTNRKRPFIIKKLLPEEKVARRMLWVALIKNGFS